MTFSRLKFDDFLGAGCGEVSAGVDDNMTWALRTLIITAIEEGPHSEAAACFLLAWYDADTHGGFSLQQLWSMDDKLLSAVRLVFHWLGERKVRPEDLGLELAFKIIGRRQTP